LNLLRVQKIAAASIGSLPGTKFDRSFFPVREPAGYQRSAPGGVRLANLGFSFLCLNPLRLEAGDSSLLTTESPLTGGRGDSPSLVGG
jgi:hypothetical protein